MSTQTPQRIILGVDPGTRVTGYAVGTIINRRVTIIDYGYLSFSSNDPIAHRVGLFHEAIERLITTHRITGIALETPFLGKNSQTFLKLGYLRGALYVLAHKYTLSLSEFTPQQVKLSVTGYGGAEKEQVGRALELMFPQLKTFALKYRNDVTDGIAVTLCGIKVS